MADPDQVIDYIVRFVSAREPVPGAAIGLEVSRRFPEFDYEATGYRGLTDLLDRAAPDLSIVGHSGGDYLWSAGSGDDDDPVDDARVPAEGIGDSVDGVPPDDIRFDQVQFRNFKGLVAQDIRLDPFTVFVGANGSGKTSVLEGIYLLGKLRDQKPGTWFAGRRDPQRLRTAGTVDPMSIAMRDTQRHCSARFETTVSPSATNTHRIYVTIGQTEWSYDFSRPLPANQPALRQMPVFQAFGGTILLRLNAHRIAKPSYLQEEVPRIRHDGLGLASVLADLAATDPTRLKRIVHAVKAIVRGFEDVRTPRAEIRFSEYRVVVVDGEEIRRRVETSRWGHRLEVKINGNWHDADLLSEGTLLALCLVAILCAPASTPRIVLMDDIDRALHPTAQRQLVDQLQAIQKDFPTLQILCTTHSPYLLDCVPPESVRVMRMSDSGAVTCKPLTDHEDWHEWRESMSAGEFWSFVGEDWFDEDDTDE